MQNNANNTTQLSRCCLVPLVMLGQGNLCCVGGHNPDKSECVAPETIKIVLSSADLHAQTANTLPSLTLLARKGSLPDSGCDDDGDDNYARSVQLSDAMRFDGHIQVGLMWI